MASLTKLTCQGIESSIGGTLETKHRATWLAEADTNLHPDHVLALAQAETPSSTVHPVPVLGYPMAWDELGRPKTDLNVSSAISIASFIAGSPDRYLDMGAFALDFSSSKRTGSYLYDITVDYRRPNFANFESAEFITQFGNLVNNLEEGIPQDDDDVDTKYGTPEGSTITRPCTLHVEFTRTNVTTQEAWTKSNLPTTLELANGEPIFLDYQANEQIFVLERLVRHPFEAEAFDRIYSRTSNRDAIRLFPQGSSKPAVELAPESLFYMYSETGRKQSRTAGNTEQTYYVCRTKILHSRLRPSVIKRLQFGSYYLADFIVGGAPGDPRPSDTVTVRRTATDDDGYPSANVPLDFSGRRAPNPQQQAVIEYRPERLKKYRGLLSSVVF